jgi:C4-dicarboxylate-specific signal transduction histidine kinase
MAFDITEKGRAQDAVQNTRAELAGSIANEINQPLAAITANANGRSGGE